MGSPSRNHMEEYDTMTEDGRIINDPEEANEHIANYFESLYQAREYKNMRNKLNLLKEKTMR